MTMLEKIAQAQFCRMNSIMHDHEEEWAKANQAIWIDCARAAVEAMKPIEGIEYILEAYGAGPGCWESIIDAILTEQQP